MANHFSRKIDLIDKKGEVFSASIIRGEELVHRLRDISVFRMRYFREFPYLYVGDFDYESQYLSGFASDKKAILMTIEKNEELIAVSTGMPLISNADILDEVPKKFIARGFKPEEFFYYGEIVVNPAYQRRGLARAIMNHQDFIATNLGFTKATLSTVLRENNDPRMPLSYIGTDSVWQALGYGRTDIQIDYSWPTLMTNGNVQSVKNPMIFWTKNLTKTSINFNTDHA